MDLINYAYFSKMKIRIGTIVEAEKVPETDKLLKLIIDLGDEKRQVISGIAVEYSEPETLIGLQIPVLVNLEPRKIKGLESQGMILCADENGAAVLLHPGRKLPNGCKIC